MSITKLMYLIFLWYDVAVQAAILAQSVERIHGKDEVRSSILRDGSIRKPLGGFSYCAISEGALRHVRQN